MKKPYVLECPVCGNRDLDKDPEDEGARACTSCNSLLRLTDDGYLLITGRAGIVYSLITLLLIAAFVAIFAAPFFPDQKNELHAISFGSFIISFILTLFLGMKDGVIRTRQFYDSRKQDPKSFYYGIALYFIGAVVMMFPFINSITELLK